MSKKFPLTTENIVTLFLILMALYLCTLYDFLLFHTLAELLSIVIAFGIFVIAWNTRNMQKNGYLLFLGIAYVFIGLLDLAHTSTYKGMVAFQTEDPDIPTQIWIIARYIQSITLLIAPVFLNKKVRPATGHHHLYLDHNPSALVRTREYFPGMLCGRKRAYSL